jgi:D-sedoheptulose 7-phosphate isomerase
MLHGSIRAELREHIECLETSLKASEAQIIEIVHLLCHTFTRGNKLLLIGNGGSAADAQHIAAEFVNRFRVDRRALPAMALTTDSSVLTCISNDSSFEEVFARQVEAFGCAGDVLVALSTSGRSANVLRAIDVATSKGIMTVGVTGLSGVITLGSVCDHCLVADSSDTARIQECHGFFWHLICGLVEKQLFTSPAFVVVGQPLPRRYDAAPKSTAMPLILHPEKRDEKSAP